METIEVHSKNFLIRWVDVDSQSHISWKVIPIKRSINFGVFERHEKHTSHSFAETTGNLTDRLNSSGFVSVTEGGISKLESSNQYEGSMDVDKKKLLAFVFDNTFSISNSKHIQFSFNVVPNGPPTPSEADGQHTAVPGDVYSAASAAANAALYRRGSADSPALPQTNVPADSGSAVPSAAPATRKLSFSRGKAPDLLTKTKRRGTISSQSGGSSVGADEEDGGGIQKLRTRQNTSSSLADSGDSHVVRSLDGRFVTGFLQKKRRKQYQGFARRYFSLDKENGLLKYYLNNRSSSLRGVMPIKIAEVKLDRQNHQFTLNSGMERWTLKAHDAKTFDVWCTEVKEVRSAGAQDEADIAVEDTQPASDDQSLTPVTSSGTTVSQSNGLPSSPRPHQRASPDLLFAQLPSLEKLQALIPSLQGESRTVFEEVYADIVDEAFVNMKKSSSQRPQGSGAGSFDRSNGDEVRKDRPQANARALSKLGFDDRLQVFYKRLQSAYFMGLSVVGLLLGALFGITYGVTFVLALVIVAAGCLLPWSSRSVGAREPFVEAYSTGGNDEYHFSSRALESLYGGGISGGSDEDDETGDISDASDEEDKVGSDGVAYVPQKPNYDAMLWQMASKSFGNGDIAPTAADDIPATIDPAANEAAISTSTESAGAEAEAKHAVAVATDGTAVEEHGKSAETSLYPLPHPDVRRRSEIKGPAHSPPSLLSMLKKAKDPSTMTAPITSNEPLSGVQSVAEMYEYSDLLDTASRAAPKSHLRMSYVAVFAVSRLASQRIKERALRKPFTPLLGETFEVVREDRGFRFLAEKVMHKPEVVATQAESPLWTVHFTSRPHTKMWAKTIQLTDVGHFSITFPDGETVSFMNPELFIRNILAGERYVEPSGTVTLESSADPKLHATIEFKAGGMFSGRSEEVKITSGPLVYEGKWTESISEGSKKIWAVKPLVNNAQKHYGWPLFTAQLNELTSIEQGQLPPNDSRLRPDLRVYEGQADLEKAEDLKLTLEQHQRERRKELEIAGKSHEPFFFVKTKDSLGHYVLKHGDSNYWVLRQKHEWDSIPHWFK